MKGKMSQIFEVKQWNIRELNRHIWTTSTGFYVCLIEVAWVRMRCKAKHVFGLQCAHCSRQQVQWVIRVWFTTAEHMNQEGQLLATYTLPTKCRKTCMMILKVVSTKTICPPHFVLVSKCWQRDVPNLSKSSRSIVTNANTTRDCDKCLVLRTPRSCSRLSGNGSVLQYSHCRLDLHRQGCACSKIDWTTDLGLREWMNEWMNEWREIMD